MTPLLPFTDLFFVPLPEGAVEVDQVHIYAGEDPLAFLGPGGDILGATHAPPGKWQLLFTLPGTDEDWGKVVGDYEAPELGGWYDFMGYYNVTLNAASSGFSLLSSNGITDKNGAILKLKK